MEAWKKKTTRCVQSDKTPRTNTKRCVVCCESAGKNPASQNSSFCKEWRFSDGNNMLSKDAAQPPSTFWGNWFSLAASKAALLRKHTVRPDQPPPRFIHTLKNKGASKVSSSDFFENVFHHKEPFVKQKDSSDVKGSLWKHLHKKVILWHCEAPLFLRVHPPLWHGT